MNGWMDVPGESAAGIIGGGISTPLIGIGMVFQVNRTEFDLAARTWRIVRGIWPIRIVKCGSLDEVSRLAVVGEKRGESDDVDFVIARLEWRDVSCTSVEYALVDVRDRSQSPPRHDNRLSNTTLARRSGPGPAKLPTSWRSPWSMRPSGRRPKS